MDTIITDLEILPFVGSKYLEPFTMSFKQNGKRRTWDCVKVFNCVSIFMYHRQKDAFLFVKQFRPAVWYSQKKSGFFSDEPGYTYELCAGILDKNLSDEQTALEEVIEETGYKLPNLERISRNYGSLGFGGNTQTMFYGEIDESMKVGEGGGIDDESIELVFIKQKDMQNFIYDESKVKGFGLMFAYLWWREFKGAK